MFGNKLIEHSHMSAHVERTRGYQTLEELQGNFHFEHWRNGQLLNTVLFPNGATNTGKQHLLGVEFCSTAQITTWYLGLIDGTAGTPAVDPTDTPVSHTGWVEFAYYNETVRQTWVNAINSPTNQVISTGAAQFTVSNAVPVSAFVAGGFLCSSNAKSGTAGTLYATGLFPNAIPVLATDVFKLNYATGL